MTTRYFDSQIFEPSSELTPAQVAERDHYVLAHLANGHVERAEIIAKGKVERVLYLRDAWSPVVAELHAKLYGAVPFSLRTPETNDNGRRARETYVCNTAGEILEIDRELSNEQGWILEEQQMGPDRTVVLITSYEYDADGMIATVTTRRAADGKTLSVQHG